jgi:hypothetical protein
MILANWNACNFGSEITPFFKGRIPMNLSSVRCDSIHFVGVFWFLQVTDVKKIVGVSIKDREGFKEILVESFLVVDGYFDERGVFEEFFSTPIDKYESFFSFENELFLIDKDLGDSPFDEEGEIDRSGKDLRNDPGIVIF